jgi:hypothetical protein
MLDSLLSPADLSMAARLIGGLPRALRRSGISTSASDGDPGLDGGWLPARDRLG